MRILKKVLLTLAALIILFLIFGFFFTRSLKPTYDGELKLANLQHEVNVFYDDYGVPHIYVQNELDARRALGYAHAQDRLWQMD